MTANQSALKSRPDPLAECLRLAMRRVAATVCVITTVDSDTTPYAMTATSVTSVSLEPPTLLACVNQKADIHRFLAAGQPFCINILSDNQEQIAKQCSQKRISKTLLLSPPWQLNEIGLPYLSQNQASIFCKLERVIDHATHSIFIGSVQHALLNDQSNSPLIYLDGQYQQPDTSNSRKTT